MPSFLLPNRASKIKHLLARHDIHLRWASVKLHLCQPLKSQNNFLPNLKYQFKNK
jgi:hypothetical protein